MSCRIIIRPEAEADMAEGFDCYEERGDSLGHEFLAEIKAVFTKIQEEPYNLSKPVARESTGQARAGLDNKLCARPIIGGKLEPAMKIREPAYEYFDHTGA